MTTTYQYQRNYKPQFKCNNCTSLFWFNITKRYHTCNTQAYKHKLPTDVLIASDLCYIKNNLNKHIYQSKKSNHVHALQTRRKYRCSVCNKIGHNRRRCTHPKAKQIRKYQQHYKHVKYSLSRFSTRRNKGVITIQELSERRQKKEKSMIA